MKRLTLVVVVVIFSSIIFSCGKHTGFQSVLQTNNLQIYSFLSVVAFVSVECNRELIQDMTDSTASVPDYTLSYSTTPASTVTTLASMTSTTTVAKNQSIPLDNNSSSSSSSNNATRLVMTTKVSLVQATNNNNNNNLTTFANGTKMAVSTSVDAAATQSLALLTLSLAASFLIWIF